MRVYLVEKYVIMNMVAQRLLRYFSMKNPQESI